MPMSCTKPQLRLFTPWVCRLHKALSEVVGTKACPGLRSGMGGSRHDRWSRHAGVRWNPLALVIRTKACPGLIRDGWFPSRPLVSSCRRPLESPRTRLVRKHVPDSDPGCVLQSTSMPALHRRNVPNCRLMDNGGMKNVARGLVPRWGRGGAWQNPPRQFGVPNHSSGFSYPCVPAPAGMSDCYESMSRTPIRDRLPPLISSFQRKLESRRGGEG